MQTTAPLNKEAPKNTGPAMGNATTNPLQGKGIGEAENPFQMMQDPLQRIGDKEDKLLQKKENPLQLKKKIQNPLQLQQPANNPLQLRAEETTALQPKKNNTGLPDNLKAGVEALSGYSMDDVKVHYNSDKPAQLQALTYAQGTDIHVAPGQEQHLPHEAWHVVQQKQGGVQPTLQMKGGVAVNDDKKLENEADVMGSKAVSLKSLNSFVRKKQSQFSGSVPVQRLINRESNAEGAKAILDSYCKEPEKLKGATKGVSGEVYLAKATAQLVKELEDNHYLKEGEEVVVKEVIVNSKNKIRTEELEGSEIPLEALLPDKLNSKQPGTANETLVSIQIIDNGSIKSYYLIMEYAKGGDQAHKNIKRTELEEYNTEAKVYYRKLESIFTELEKSGYSSGDIKPANIFIDPDGMPMLGDFGDYTKGTYLRKNEDIEFLMNNLMGSSGHEKKYQQIVNWANEDSLWLVKKTTEIPKVLSTGEAVDKAINTEQ